MGFPLRVPYFPDQDRSRNGRARPFAYSPCLEHSQSVPRRPPLPKPPNSIRGSFSAMDAPSGIFLLCDRSSLKPFVVKNEIVRSMTETIRQLRPVWIFTKASSVPTCETEKREGVRKKYLEQTVRCSLGLRRFIVGEGRYWNRRSYFLGSTFRHELSPGQL